MEPILPLIPPYAKWIMTAILSLIAIVLYLVRKTYARKQVMIAMLLSSFADIFMTDMFGIGTISAGPGIAGFFAAHTVYALCFTNLCKQKGWSNKNPGLYFGIIVMIVSVIVIAIYAFSIETPNYLFFFGILIYVAIIGWNLCCNFAYSYKAKGLQITFLPFAIVLFYITDIWIFFQLLNIDSRLRDMVWYFYPIAQLLLIIFVEPFKKKDEPVYYNMIR